MKTLFTLLVAAGLSLSVSAHEGHEHHYVTETVAVDIGKQFAAAHTQADSRFGLGKLPASWGEVPAENAKLLRNGDGFYIVTVTNDDENKTLYVLMSSEGGIWDANFTGEFDQVKD